MVCLDQEISDGFKNWRQKNKEQKLSTQVKATCDKKAYDSR